MRILMCCADWGIPVGGAAGSSVHLRSLASALAQSGHEVRLVTSNGDGPFRPDVPVETVPHRRLWPALANMVDRVRGRLTGPVPASSPPAGPGPSSAGNAPAPAEFPEDPSPSWKTRLYYETLPALADQVEEMLVHPAGFRRALERIMDSFKPDAVYERYALCQTGAAQAVKRAGRSGPPHLLEVNASLARERAGLTGPWARLAARREVRLWRGADRVLCVSDALRRMAEATGADPARILVLPNGVDVERFRPDRPKGTLRRLLGIGPEPLLVGWLGALSPGRGAEKFLELLARSLPAIDNAMGVLIGDGPLYGDCRRLARDLGLDGRVAFTGMVPHDTIPDLLVDLDVAVSCYPQDGKFYFSPMKVAEYLACGLAVLAGRPDAAGGTIEDGINGLVAEVDDIRSWPLALGRLCRDADLRARLGAEARRRALTGPTWLGNARRIEREILACRQERKAGARP